MRNVNKLIAGLLVLAVAGLVAIPVAAKNGDARTSITPHLKAPIAPGQSVLFCSTFQIAWNSMKSDILNEDVRLEKLLDLVKQLNNGVATKDDIAADDYYTTTGFGRAGLAESINEALKEKFGNGAPTVGQDFNQRDVIVAYSALRKILKFADPFEDFQQPFSFHGDLNRARVESFGISERENARLRNQVEIIECAGRNNLIIRLKSENPEDEIILAKVPPGETLLETFENVNAQVANGTPRAMGNSELLRIPKVDISLDHSYSSLLGLYLLNSGFEKYFVARADQNIDFRLDESGAVTKSDATFMLKKMYIPLAFNEPFLLYLKQKDGRYPYLALWVGNAGLLVHSE